MKNFNYLVEKYINYDSFFIAPDIIIYPFQEIYLLDEENDFS